MAGWTKADYYAAYSICPRGVYQYPDGHTEARRFVEVRLHYHPAVLSEYFDKHAQMIIDGVTNPIDASSHVVIFGSGFGWLCEKLVALTGCTCVGVDTSDYIAQNKDLSPDDELEESIVAAGLDKNSGMGQQVFDQFSKPGPRTTADVRQLDLAVKRDQNILKRDLPNVTHMISEEVWQVIDANTQQEVTSFFNNNYPGIEIHHIIDSVFI